MKMRYLALIIVVLAVIAFSGACITGFCAAGTPEDTFASTQSVIEGSKTVLSAEANLAQCLTDNGAVMYGAYWCGHCNNQKDMFGDAFQYVNYVECTEDQAACNAAGIGGYPTWKINGQNYPGEKSLEGLAELAGCEY